MKIFLQYVWGIVCSTIWIYSIVWLFYPIFPLPFFNNFPNNIISMIVEWTTHTYSYYTATWTNIYYHNEDNKIQKISWLSPWNTTIIADVIAIKDQDVYSWWKPIELDVNELKVVTTTSISNNKVQFGWKIFPQILYFYDNKNVYSWTARNIWTLSEGISPYDIYTQDQNK